MRAILIVATLMSGLLHPGVCLGDDYDDCKLKCAAERDTRNANCPAPADSSDEARAQCLKDSQDAYIACVRDCPQPSSSRHAPSSLALDARKPAVLECKASHRDHRAHTPKPAAS